ncbi:hypothetical protein [Streptomyces sp. NPDC003023]|uniref:hypothetical protein n=1 Tax=Streptomyces sp. NPDC003023 TaxID=3364675 RepID=UPI0036B162FA
MRRQVLWGFWQMWSHWLTGGRVQVLALRKRVGDGGWSVATEVVNVGRQDVTVVAYTVWLDVDGMRWRCFKWKVRMLFRVGLSRIRST